MSDKLFKTLAYLGGAAAIYSGYKKKKKAERQRIIAQNAALRQQSAGFSATGDNQQQGPNQVSNANPSGGTPSQVGSSINSTITGSGSYQMTADTNASLPILYGQCQVRGSVVDAALDNGNAQLKTVMVLGERTGVGALGNADYTLNRLYWNDTEIELHANGVVSNAILNDGTATTKYNDKMRVYMFSGDIFTEFANVLGSAPTYNNLPTLSGGLGFDKWNNQNYFGRGALWAYIVQDYDAENGIQGLGTWTFDITNQDYSNPGNIIADYLTNERYGHGYPSSSVNVTSLTGTASTSLRSISDELRFFTSLDSNDASGVNLSNGDQCPQFVTTGNSFATYIIGESDLGAVGNLSANTANIGTTTGDTDNPVESEEYNRLKIIWAQGDGSGNVANITTNLTSNNEFTAFLDIARLIPDAAGFNQGGPDSNVVAGTTYPGQDYFYGSQTGNVTAKYFPNTPIVDFLVEGDRIRPEGSPYIYTVASNVTVDSPGYRTFTIPVKERIHYLDPANTDFNVVDANAGINTTLNVPGANSGVYTTFILSDDIRGIYQNKSFPFDGATGSGHANATLRGTYDIIPDAVFSNCLIGNASHGENPHITLPQEDTVYLGQEKQAEINGLLSTEGDVQTNLRELLKHSGATLTWELPEGQWKAIPNANTSTANAFVLNDDNIIGEIRIATSDLSNFYNSARASYVEKTHNSVKEEIIIYTPDSQKATNETRHMLEVNYPLTSSGTEAIRKVEQELIQNRLDMTVNLTADYSAMTVEVGDIVKLTNSDYGFTDKLFRVLKTVQDMDDDILTVKMTLLEWDLAIFKERVPFKKPALDDIEFDPEEYDDNTDGAGVRSNSMPGSRIVSNSIANTQITDGTITGDKVGSNTIIDLNLGSTGVTGGSYGGICLTLGNGTLCIPDFNVTDKGRLDYSANLGIDTTRISHLGQELVLNPASTTLQTLYTRTFQLNAMDAGEHMLVTDYLYSGAYTTINYIMDGDLYKAGETTVRTYYPANNDTIMSNVSQDQKGSALNNRIDGFVDISTHNYWHTGDAFTSNVNANVRLDVTMKAIHYYDGTYLSNLTAVAHMYDQGVMRANI